ncbi:MAG: phage holin family protein [Anaerolineaceae bacterium]|jgi:putative membrane protein|nr:phage holin family protein [Anaerolineaceae bacterium]
MNLIKRWLVIMLALFVAAWIVPGIHVSGNGWTAYAIMAAVLALLNAILLPILKTLSCGMIVLTLGLFSLVLNAAMFLLSSNISQNFFSAGYLVDGFWPALLGSLIVSAATMLFAGNRSRDRDDD